MFNSSFNLGHIMGVKIGINMSLLLIAGLITLSMAESYYPATLPRLDETVVYLLSIATAFLFFFSILWHEMAHALMARYFDIPVKGIVLNLIGGMTHMEEEPNKPHQFFWIAIIGPISSAIIAVIFGVLSLVVGDGTTLSVMFRWLAWVNAALTGFNLIPGFPLDGGRALMAGIWWLSGNYLRGAQIATGTGKFFALGVVGIAFLQIFALADIFGSVWSLFIAGFLWSAASEYMRYAKTKHNLATVPVLHAISSHVYVRPEWTILYALDEMSINGTHSVAPVFEGQDVVGVFGIDVAVAVPRYQWQSVTVRQTMKQVNQLPSIDANADLFQALSKIERARAPYMVVKQDEHTIGVVGRHELMRLADQKQGVQTI